jgi:4-hydroxythreonine-4-phosphate dehydrogenase
MLVVSIGCPCGIGPEVAVAAAERVRNIPCVLVGDLETIRAAAEVVGIDRSRVVPFGTARGRRWIFVLEVGPKLSQRDRRPGHPGKRAGQAQLAYVNAAYDFARSAPGRALVTGPVSKAVIARSGGPGAESFLGHTEWLRDRDGAQTSVMCFAGRKLVTGLATTHVPIADLPRAITRENVADACYWLARLVGGLGRSRPSLAVCSLNPHAGESELLGHEEREAIVPGMQAARRRLRGAAVLSGPIGAETAYRKAHGGGYDGVVAMYHDQATVPMKLVAFGEAVNVTMGLSVVRTSVDHGTGYDIAWQGKASASGMVSALRLAARLVAA